MTDNIHPKTHLGDFDDSFRHSVVVWSTTQCHRQLVRASQGEVLVQGYLDTQLGGTGN